jgi:hypothetical protein
VRAARKLPESVAIYGFMYSDSCSCASATATPRPSDVRCSFQFPLKLSTRVEKFPEIGKTLFYAIARWISTEPNATAE